VRSEIVIVVKYNDYDSDYENDDDDCSDYWTDY
jgi:hypothetical protein